MNWLARVFAAAVVRRVAILLVGLVLAYIGIGHARAAGTCELVSGNNWSCTDKPAAWQKAQSLVGPKAAVEPYCPGGAPVGVGVFDNPSEGAPTGSVIAAGWCWGPPGPGQTDVIFGNATYSSTCAAGSTWNATTHQCALACAGGAQEDPLHPGTCLDDNKCKARNADLGIAPAIRTWTQRCVGGCNIVMDSPTTTNAGGQTFSTGTLRYTGICGENDASDPKGPTNEDPTHKPSPEPDKCVPAGNGQTFCRKPDGKNCYTAHTGRQICWTPNDSATEKPDGDTLQKKCNGTSCPDLPDQPPPPNDTFTKGDSTTITDNKDGTSKTTTFTNYTTGTGGPAGDSNSGCPSNGTSGCTGESPGEGEDKGKGNEVGGGDCPAPYSCSGGDASLCAILKEEHDQRCRGEKNDADTLAFASSHPMEGDAPPGAFDGDGEGSGLVLNDSGFGFGRSCPAAPEFDFMGVSHTIDTTALCTLAGMVGIVILMAAFVQAGFIVAGD